MAAATAAAGAQLCRSGAKVACADSASAVAALAAADVSPAADMSPAAANDVSAS